MDTKVFVVVFCEEDQSFVVPVQLEPSNIVIGDLKIRPL